MAVPIRGWEVVRRERRGSGCCAPAWEKAGDAAWGSEACCGGGDCMKSAVASILVKGFHIVGFGM
jgi:hypothetical protein